MRKKLASFCLSVAVAITAFAIMPMSSAFTERTLPVLEAPQAMSPHQLQLRSKDLPTQETGIPF
jgi:hypothetical protein